MRKLPSTPVAVSRSKPLTGFETATFAPGITPPVASFTTPSIDPELPNCACTGIAANHKLKINPRNTELRKRFNMIFSVPVGPCMRGESRRWMESGESSASQRLGGGQKATEQTSREWCYAEGGARPARSTETSSRAAVTTGRESYQLEICGAEAIPLTTAVSAGAGSVPQLSQAVSGPPLCSCRGLPPPA